MTSLYSEKLISLENTKLRPVNKNYSTYSKVEVRCENDVLPRQHASAIVPGAEFCANESLNRNRNS